MKIQFRQIGSENQAFEAQKNVASVHLRAKVSSNSQKSIPVPYKVVAALALLHQALPILCAHNREVVAAGKEGHSDWEQENIQNQYVADLNDRTMFNLPRRTF